MLTKEQLLRMAPLVDNPTLYKSFIDVLQTELDVEINSIKRCKIPETIYDAQGAIRVYEKLMRLREQLNSVRNQ
jgi:hypothetical protein